MLGYTHIIQHPPARHTHKMITQDSWLQKWQSTQSWNKADIDVTFAICSSTIQCLMDSTMLWNREETEKLSNKEMIWTLKKAGRKMSQAVTYTSGFFQVFNLL